MTADLTATPADAIALAMDYAEQPGGEWWPRPVSAEEAMQPHEFEVRKLLLVLRGDDHTPAQERDIWLQIAAYATKQAQEIEAML